MLRDDLVTAGSDIIIGADVSGNPSVGGQARYIALVVGTADSIDGIYQKIGLSQIHMVSMKKSKRQTVIRNMEFNNNDLIGACVHVQRQKTVDEMLGEPGFVAKSRQKSKSKLYRHFDYLLFREIKDLTEPFAFQRRCEAKDITMQCDSDMVRTGKNWGMNTSDKGKAYEIADALAWCNEHGIKISQCRELELADKICAEMRHDMIK